jgi:hypothetical protein
MSTTIAVVVDDELPAAIRREHEAASAAALSALGHALECGRLLAQARQGIAHGGWESFVRDRCGIAPRTASLYQRLHANRERLANRQRVAGLTVREAARLVAEPRVAEPEAGGERFDFLGQWHAAIDCVSLQFNPAWRIASPSCPPPAPPAWYSPGHRHTAVHRDGWCFEVSPDSLVPGRVNTIVHDSLGEVHFASFDGMSPAGIVPFLTACERHGGMPPQYNGWTIEKAAVPSGVLRLRRPFPLEIFELASKRGHRCHCWALIDEAIGESPIQEKPGARAWELYGIALGWCAPKPEPRRRKAEVPA